MACPALQPIMSKAAQSLQAYKPTQPAETYASTLLALQSIMSKAAQSLQTYTTCKNLCIHTVCITRQLMLQTCTVMAVSMIRPALPCIADHSDGFSSLTAVFSAAVALPFALPSNSLTTPSWLLSCATSSAVLPSKFLIPVFALLHNREHVKTQGLQLMPQVGNAHQAQKPGTRQWGVRDTLQSVCITNFLRQLFKARDRT